MPYPHKSAVIEKAMILYSFAFCFTAFIQNEIKAMPVKRRRASKKSVGKPHGTVPVEVIFTVLKGAVTAKTMHIPARIKIFLSTSCLCSAELAVAANTKESGHKSLPVKVIFPQKKSRSENVDHKPKNGVRMRTLSHRQPAENIRKKMISVHCVFSNRFFNI